MKRYPEHQINIIAISQKYAKGFTEIKMPANYSTILDFKRLFGIHRVK
jgi:hypothetical protein